jgi:hypothetical protein
VEWLAGAEGGEVLIVFDECHRAKSLDPAWPHADPSTAVTLDCCLQVVADGGMPDEPKSGIRTPHADFLERRSVFGVVPAGCGRLWSGWQVPKVAKC